MRRALLALVLLAGLAGTASAATNYYVSTTGGGADPCSLAAPCSLAHAQAVVRAEVAAGLTCPITVDLGGETYTLSATMAFTGADSGTATNPIRWQNGTLDGGLPVTEWELHEGGIYRTAITPGWTFRQLYVNGVHAQRARSGLYPNGPTWTITAGGYTAPDSSMASWGNKSDIEIHHIGGWGHNSCKVATIVGTAVTMGTPCWDYLSPLFLHYHLDQNPYFVENAYELMASGSWYLDKTANYLYYWPPSGSMTGLTVVAPSVANPITVTGASYLTFQGITFDHSNWLGPDNSVGYVAVQSGYTWQQTPDYVPTHGTLMDAAVAVSGSNHIAFTGNMFTHLGSRGLLIYGGSSNVTVSGGTFADNAGGDIQIGDANNCATTQESDITITGNKANGGHFQYDDNGAIFMPCATGSTITGNEVGYSRWSGIGVGWGWSVVSFTRNNTVTNNWIHDFCTPYGDCDGVYTNGPQLINDGTPSTDLYHFAITPTAVNGDLFYDLSNAPATFWDHVKTTGADIRVTTQDGTTQVPREVEALDPNDHTGSLYMGTAGGTATGLVVNYSNAYATEPAGSATYGATKTWDSTLKGVWHMNGAATPMLNSATGTNDFAITGGATYGSVGKIGKSVGFGTGIYAQPSVTLATDIYSVSLWTNLAVVLSPEYLFSRGADVLHSDAVGIYAGKWIVFNATTVLSGSSTPQAYTWYHVVFIRSGTAVKLYINNVKEIDTTETISYESGALWFGARPGPNNIWVGAVDEIRVWDNYNLTSTEIANLYANQGTPASYWTTSAETATVWTPGLTITGNYLNNAVNKIGSYTGCGGWDVGSNWLTFTNNVCQLAPRAYTVGTPNLAGTFNINYLSSTATIWNYGGDAAITTPNTTITDTAQPFGTPAQAVICAAGVPGATACTTAKHWPQWQTGVGATWTRAQIGP
jgi:hypothetical protein